MESSNTQIVDTERPAFDSLEMGDVIIETNEIHGVAHDEISLNSSISLEKQSFLATESRSVRSRIWKNQPIGFQLLSCHRCCLCLRSGIDADFGIEVIAGLMELSCIFAASKVLA